MKSSTVVFFIIWFVYLSFFSFITTIIRENGYLNFEPSFITNHLNTFAYKGELVKHFFLSYPLLPNVLTYPFVLFSTVDAPFFASIFFSSLFYTFVVTKAGFYKNYILKTLVFLYFLISPVSVYAATSGTSVYAFYILYFYIFYFLFHYVKNFTTYHLAILSIILSLCIFLNYKILYLLLTLLFYLFIFSIYRIKGLAPSNIIIKYIKISQHVSLRRKFRGHFFSMLFVVSFLPVSSLFLYFLINYLIGNNYLYFYNNAESKWNAISIFNFISSDALTAFRNKAVNDYYFITIIIYLTPIFFFEVISYFKEGIKLFIMLLVPLLLFIYIKDRNSDYMNLSFYIIIIASGVASFSANKNKVLIKNKLNYLAYFMVFSLAIFGEHHYFKITNYTSENVYYNSLFYNKHNTLLQLQKKAGGYLAKNTVKNSRVLLDKSLLYSIVAFNKKHNYFVTNSSSEFKKAINNPAKYCDYIVVYNSTSKFYNLDKVNLKLFEETKGKETMNTYQTKTVYLNKEFKILEILK